MRITGLQAQRGGARRLRAALAVFVLVVVAGAVAAAPAGAAAGGEEQVTIARGLDNPRGLVLLGDGRLAVAEAGHAGTVCLGPGECLGLTGRVTAIDARDGDRTALATGLPSLGGPVAAFGLGGLALQHGRLHVVVGLNPQAFGGPAAASQGATDAACVATVTAAQAGAGVLSRVRSLKRDRGVRPVASVGRFDFDYAAAHPDPGNPEYAPGDANPFGLTAAPSGGFYVVDAASNTLDLVSRRGAISVLAFVPDPPNHLPIYDAAPTCAARTPDGDVYVGTESSSLWRWDGTRLTQVLSGGKVGQVVGCVADDDGNLYLANLSSRIGGSVGESAIKPFDGSIVKVTPDLTTSYVAEHLNFPTGLALGEDDELYVALNRLCPADVSLLTSADAPLGGCARWGEVVRLGGGDADEGDGHRRPHDRD